MTRAEAIAILKKGTMFEPTLENKDYIEAFEMAIKALEPKTGHWIADGLKRNFLDTDIKKGVAMKRDLGKGYHTYINEACSVCRKITIHDASIAYAYCPHCGAKMEG